MSAIMRLEMENTRESLPARIAVYRVAILLMGLIGMTISASTSLFTNVNYLVNLLIVVVAASYRLIKQPAPKQDNKKPLRSSSLVIILVYLIITVGWFLGHWHDDKLVSLPWLLLGYASFTLMNYLIDKPKVL